MAALLMLLLGSWSPTAASADGGALVLRHGPRAEKVVALTFDDGWGRSANERILRILVEEGVPATFFPYALAVRSNPSFWRRVARAGFPIGNHSWSHPDMTRLTRHEMEWQIAASARLVESVTGVPMIRVFRPPYGRHDARVLAAAASRGFGTILLWDATAGDSGAGPSLRSVLRGASAGTNGSVVLLHAGPTVTPAALRSIIAGYRARGFRFVTVPELLGESVAPWPSAPPAPTPSAQTGLTTPPEPTGGPGPTATPPSTGTPWPTAVPTSSAMPGAPPVAHESTVPAALLAPIVPLTALLDVVPPAPSRSQRSGPVAS